MRVINKIAGIILGLALLSIVWFRSMDFAVHTVIFEYITRSTATTPPNNALLIYPIIGMFVGGVLVTIIVRRNKQYVAIEPSASDPIWLMLLVFILSIAGGAFIGHTFG